MPAWCSPATVDKHQTVRFENNHYSVPRRHVFQSVTVKVYFERVAVVAGGHNREKAFAGQPV